MYAKQAQQYVGDSSLDIEDQEEFNDSVANSNSNIEEDKLDDSTVLDTDNQEKSNHHYNYEEIDLNDITQRHEVNDDDVTVSDAVNHDNDNDSVQDQLEHHSIDNATEDEIVQQDSEDKTQSYDNGDRVMKWLIVNLNYLITLMMQNIVKSMKVTLQLIM